MAATHSPDAVHVRFVTATSLFDGHDAAINIIRRMLQAGGSEVIHLGHNRSVEEIVHTAIQEDVHGIAVSSYQGGHLEYFKYMVDLLEDHEAGHIKIFGGGGGVIVPAEIKALEHYGVAKIFSPADGFEMGLQGMVRYMIEACDSQLVETIQKEEASATTNHPRRLARALTVVEHRQTTSAATVSGQAVSTLTDQAGDVEHPSESIVLGVTGTGGAGKSTFIDECIRRFLHDFPDDTVAILSVDPSRRRTGGALLGDRLRMNAIYGAHANRVYMRSFATRNAGPSTSSALREAVDLCRQAGFDLIIIETAGIGQSDTHVIDLSNISVYVMTAEYGAPTQLEKIGMLDAADFMVLNKFEKQGSRDALRDIRKQVQRNRVAFDQSPDEMPVFPTMASHSNDAGVTNFYLALINYTNECFQQDRISRIYGQQKHQTVDPEAAAIIPPSRQRYLAEGVETCRMYRSHIEEQVAAARRWEHAREARKQLDRWDGEDTNAADRQLGEMAEHWWDKLDARSQEILTEWDERAAEYRKDTFTYTVRDKEITADLYSESLSGLRIPRIALPRTESSAERLRFALLENLPGYFPFTAGVFPFKRTSEDPTRMFAGEGSPERTNKRFHLVSEGMVAKRLSTAFDSVTLYGADPADRPDIYGKIGNAGVSICTLDDMKKLYSGFNLCDPKTSVSMTINGPAPMILAMFMNTAIDQQVELMLKEEGRWPAVDAAIDEHLGERPRYIPHASEKLPEGHDGFGLGMLGVTGSDLVGWDLLERETYETIKTRTLQRVRGTVQADILKEDQAQNTCIFSTEFALRLMGDVQEQFVNRRIRNFYSISISGYHIAEAGANPITQLAFTLANGFTYVEYFLSRGLDIDDFAPNLSFFFSNGMDPEYSVIGRVARRIWAVTLRDKYGANERSQKLKYHIQTSGRSLHAREIQYNDIRTTLQALMAIYDNCNSLHTNAYDEAITTPTEESVRRAIAIQLIINKELGLAKNENPLQGSYIIEELTDLVEEAVLLEFERLNRRGGVLGAMETMYQRGKIQDESLAYESKKHSGELPLIGVNTFLPENGRETGNAQVELMRSTDEEKRQQIEHLQMFQRRHAGESERRLEQLQHVARNNENIFAELMETVKYCSLGQITNALFEVGGQYRRNM